MKLLRTLAFWLAISCVVVAQSANEKPEIPAGVNYKLATGEVNVAAKTLLGKGLAGDKAALRELLSEFLTCGPTLWQDLKPGAEPALVHAKPVTIVISTPVAVATEGRALLTDEARQAFWAELMGKYPGLASAKVRKAKAREISYYWATIPFDIEEPFFATGADVFIAHMTQQHGKTTLFWIDRVGELSSLKPQPPSDETTKNIVEALAKDAETQSPQAMLQAGKKYLSGDGVSPDAEKGRTLLDGAARKGVLEAQLLLGMAYFAGKYVPQDRARAAPYLQMAAEQGSATAQYYLGMMYLQGDGVEKSVEKSMPYLQKAADQNFAAAEYGLGAIFFQGIGVAPDKARACALYAKAADQGYVAAVNDLGWCYQQGEGVEKDLTKAMALYLKAADAGHLRGQGNLAMLYRAAGEWEKAYTWLRIAELSGGGSQARPVIDEVKKHMTQSQLDAAEVTVAQWQKAHATKR